MNVFEMLFCCCIVVLLAGVSLAQAEQSLDESSIDDIDNRRAWYALRLGRGLQMLRLGKRSANVGSTGSQGPSYDNRNILSTNEIENLLNTFFGPRDESRRQPPLPRYGRDGEGYNRPAPRGGRYKRSIQTDKMAFEKQRDHARTVDLLNTADNE